MVEAAIHYHQRHPELDIRQDNFLYSINQWGRAIAKALGCGEVGEEFEPLSLAYLDDLYRLLERDAKAKEDAEAAKRKSGAVTEETLRMFAAQMPEDAPPA